MRGGGDAGGDGVRDRAAPGRPPRPHLLSHPLVQGFGTVTIRLALYFVVVVVVVESNLSVSLGGGGFELARASGVCRKWRRGVVQSLARKERLSFAGWNVDDESASRVVRAAYNITELDVSRSCWGCQITDLGLYKISQTKCVGNLLSISLWGVAGITDKGVIQLVSTSPL
ncbi:hypothetical protein ZIOFF_054776 [Zingiber officinale]|uniref:Uncharacterized protein n=1 Tax=Zingiber officinale TaxID=94328 RepID=A0A8J5FV34_ZINOF|nr:hypothetical protein ZIOFF_054776 [Zingiber officinale]